MARILIIEDETVLSKNIRRALSGNGHTVESVSSCSEARRAFSAFEPELALVDLRLPDGNGSDLLGEFLGLDPTVSIVVMTAYASVEDAIQAIKQGATNYLQKPMSMADLDHAVSRALEERKLRHEVSYYRKRASHRAELDQMLGSSSSMVALKARIQRLSTLPSDQPPPVLIEGETGTGKSLVARVLHHNGPRRDRPFIEVNCGAMPDNLVEAELFGYKRGAFTDAKASKLGLFAAADEGTLFLDEVGCLSPSMQIKLLSAIEQKTIRPLGSCTEQKVDVQVVTATNSDLEAMVRDGTFREDLYYRIRVAALHVPALRERGDDILLLAEAFLAELSAGYRFPTRELSAEASRAAMRYRWPGNVRELRNTLDRAILFSESETLDVQSLGLPGSSGLSFRAAMTEGGAMKLEIPDEGIRFEEVERALILGGLKKAGGSQAEAARLLGMTRDTLRYRMEKFGIRAS